MAWLVLVSGFAATAWTAMALRSIPTNEPRNALIGYAMFYLAPIACMIVPFLVFETWACIRTGARNPWPIVVLIYVCTVSAQAMLLFATTTIHNRQDLLMLRQQFAGPLSVFGAVALTMVLGFYAVVLVGQAKRIPFTASAGRGALWLWLTYFACTRLWQPVAAINQTLETMR